MKILIVSDSHGRNDNIEKVLEKIQSIDLFIHLGDMEGNSDYIEAILPCEGIFIAGNNDYFSDMKRERIITIGNYKVLLTHGHQYGVNSGTSRLKEIAALQDINIVLYGHTHVPSVDMTDSVWLVNPGSVSLPRQADNKASYCIMEIDRKGVAHFTINYCR